jgi:hypothetical protein
VNYASWLNHQIYLHLFQFCWYHVLCTLSHFCCFVLLFPHPTASISNSNIQNLRIIQGHIKAFFSTDSIFEFHFYFWMCLKLFHAFNDIFSCHLLQSFCLCLSVFVNVCLSTFPLNNKLIEWNRLFFSVFLIRLIVPDVKDLLFNNSLIKNFPSQY